MVGPQYIGYFTASSAAAGVLIGLLFVAVSFRADSIFGDHAVPGGRALAASAFIGLVNAFLVSLLAIIPRVNAFLVSLLAIIPRVNAFLVSLLAIIPRVNLGIVAIVMALVSLYNTVKFHVRLARTESHIALLLLSLAAYLVQLVDGLLIMLRPHDQTLTGNLCYVVISSFSVALVRAWALLQGKHIIAVSQGGESVSIPPA